ncbi:MAG: metallophosphoesterase family protein [Acidiferrobacter sp.]
MRFLHCADLHLDSPLRGLEQYEGAPAQAMRQATRRAFENVVDLAIEREIDFLLIAGDIFDGDLQDFNAGLFFANQLRRLGDADIRVFIVRGNHDALSKISKSVPYPANVHVFKATQPETVTIDVLGVAIHGQSFATGAVTEDLSAAYPDAAPGVLNIGILHTALAGREGHESYAPTTSERLAAKGYHYWALGHVHTREIVQKDPCWIAFPGNPQGRHARELGPKGCLIVEADEQGVQSVEFVETDVARWQHVSIDATDLTLLDGLQAVIQAAVQGELREAGDRVLAVRLSITGRTPLHGHIVASPESFRAEVCAWLNEASGGMAWLEKLNLSVSAPLDLAALAERDDPFGLLVRKFDELGGDSVMLAALADPILGDLYLKIPPDLRDHDPFFNPLSVELRAQALAAARERLLAAMSAEGGQS